jgi:hypothetical protein
VGPEHITWLNEVETLTTADGREVAVFELSHTDDAGILSSWAAHFRSHYCLDSDVDILRGGTGLSRSAYLTQIKFPDESSRLGPSIRAGDFAEILIADYMEYVLEYWVPRTRYGNKTVRNDSTKGCDIIGFAMLSEGEDSPDDLLAVFETKTQFSGRRCAAKLQEAIDHSGKDQVRKAESLNAIKQQLLGDGNTEGMDVVERFQNIEDRPYTEVSGAAALFCTSVYDESTVSRTVANSHPNAENLALVVVRGDNMMALVHDLYERAANEA